MTDTQTQAKRRGRKPQHTVEKVREKLVSITKEDKPFELDTFHYHFSEEMGERFMYFATLHRFDDRKSFKENWQKWIEEPDVAECIQTEIDKVKESGYVGDVIGKMFRSVRYYYRKKPVKPQEEGTAEKKKRKVYEMTQKETLAEIDRHILEQITGNCSDLTETKRSFVSPAKAFANYVETQHDGVEEKYKKIYKNRFYLLAKTIRSKPTTVPK